LQLALTANFDCPKKITMMQIWKKVGVTTECFVVPCSELEETMRLAEIGRQREKQEAAEQAARDSQKEQQHVAAAVQVRQATPVACATVATGMPQATEAQATGVPLARVSSATVQQPHQFALTDVLNGSLVAEDIDGDGAEDAVETKNKHDRDGTGAPQANVAQATGVPQATVAQATGVPQATVAQATGVTGGYGDPWLTNEEEDVFEKYTKWVTHDPAVHAWRLKNINRPNGYAFHFYNYYTDVSGSRRTREAVGQRLTIHDLRFMHYEASPHVLKKHYGNGFQVEAPKTTTASPPLALPPLKVRQSRAGRVANRKSTMPAVVPNPTLAVTEAVVPKPILAAARVAKRKSKVKAVAAREKGREQFQGKRLRFSESLAVVTFREDGGETIEISKKRALMPRALLCVSQKDNGDDNDVYDDDGDDDGDDDVYDDEIDFSQRESINGD